MHPPFVNMAAEEAIPIHVTEQDHLLHQLAQCIFFPFVPPAIRSHRV
jgi:hypothetical protein